MLNAAEVKRMGELALDGTFKDVSPDKNPLTRLMVTDIFDRIEDWLADEVKRPDANDSSVSIVLCLTDYMAIIMAAVIFRISRAGSEDEAAEKLCTFFTEELKFHMKGNQTRLEALIRNVRRDAKASGMSLERLSEDQLKNNIISTLMQISKETSK